MLLFLVTYGAVICADWDACQSEQQHDITEDAVHCRSALFWHPLHQKFKNAGLETVCIASQELKAFLEIEGALADSYQWRQLHPMQGSVLEGIARLPKQLLGAPLFIFPLPILHILSWQPHLLQQSLILVMSLPHPSYLSEWGPIVAFCFKFVCTFLIDTSPRWLPPNSFAWGCTLLVEFQVQFFLVNMPQARRARLRPPRRRRSRRRTRAICCAGGRSTQQASRTISRASRPP